MTINGLAFKYDASIEGMVDADIKAVAVAVAGDNNLVCLVENDNTGDLGADYYLGVYDPHINKWIALGDSTEEWPVIYKYIPRDAWVGGRNENSSLRECFEAAARANMRDALVDVLDGLDYEADTEEDNPSVTFTYGCGNAGKSYTLTRNTGN